MFTTRTPCGDSSLVLVEGNEVYWTGAKPLNSIGSLEAGVARLKPG